jgi:hypothetical protein
MDQGNAANTGTPPLKGVNDVNTGDILYKIDLLDTFKEQGFCRKLGSRDGVRKHARVLLANEYFKAAAIFRTAFLVDSIHDFGVVDMKKACKGWNGPKSKFKKTQPSQPDIAARMTSRQKSMKNTLLYQCIKDILYLMDLPGVVCPKFQFGNGYDNHRVTWSDQSENIFKKFLTVVKEQLEFYFQNQPSVSDPRPYTGVRVHFLRQVDPRHLQKTAAASSTAAAASSTAAAASSTAAAASKDIHFYINPINFVGGLEEVVIGDDDTDFSKIVSLKQYFYSASGKVSNTLYTPASNKKTLHDLYINKLAEDSFNLEHIRSLEELLEDADNDATMPNTVVDPFMDDSANQNWLQQWTQAVPKEELYNSYVFVIMHIIDRLMEDNNTRDDGIRKYYAAKAAKEAKVLEDGAKEILRKQQDFQRKQLRPRRAAQKKKEESSDDDDDEEDYWGKGGAQKGGVIKVNEDKNMWDLDLLFQCLGAEKYTPTQRGEGGEMSIEMNEIIKILCLKRSKDKGRTCLDKFKARIGSIECSESISLYDVEEGIKEITLQVDAAGKNRCSSYVSQTLKIVQSIYAQAEEALRNREFRVKKTLATIYDAAQIGNVERVVGPSEKTYGLAESMIDVLGGADEFSFRTDVVSNYAHASDAKEKFAITIGDNTILQLHYETGSSNLKGKKGKAKIERTVRLVIEKWFGQDTPRGGETDGSLNGAILRYFLSDESLESYEIFCELLKKTMGDFGQVLYYHLASKNAKKSELVLFHTLDRFCAGIGSLFGKGVVCEQHSDAQRDCDDQIISDFHNTFYVTRAQKTILSTAVWEHEFKGSPLPKCAANELVRKAADELALKGRYALLVRQMAEENFKTLRAYGSILALFGNITAGAVQPFVVDFQAAKPEGFLPIVFVVEEKVFATSREDSFWKPGVVTNIYEDGSVDINYDDGVKASHLVPIKMVKKWASGWGLYIQQEVNNIQQKWKDEKKEEAERLRKEDVAGEDGGEEGNAENMKGVAGEDGGEEGGEEGGKEGNAENMEDMGGGAKSKTRKKHRKQKSNRRKYPNKCRSIKSKLRIKKRTLKNRRK